jgi:gliding motility-associated protein GldM
MFILLLDGLLHRTGWSKLPGIKSSEQEIAVAIAPTKMNVLYYGIDNPLSIAASEVDNDKLEVKIDNGTIKGEKGFYIVNPQDAEKLATVQVFSDHKEIGKASFRVKLVPEPTATVAGMGSGTSMSKALFLDQKGVVAVLPDFAFDLKFKITEFILVTIDGNYSVESKSNSDQFTQEQLELIKKVKTDTRVTIENIKALGPDGKTRDLKPLVFKIK